MKHALITGATRGLGRALALALAKQDLTLALCGTNEQAVAELAQRLGPKHLVMRCDVTSADEVAAFAAAAVERAGPPDLPINNAALINPSAPLWEVSADDFSRVIDVNLKGIHLVIRALLPAMIERGSGIVVNLSSGWGRSASPEVAPYCCTKWGVEGLTAALALELPPGLAAIPLNPGVIDTDMLRSCFGDGAGQYPSPEEWAERAVPLLLSLTPARNGEPLTV